MIYNVKLPYRSPVTIITDSAELRDILTMQYGQFVVCEDNINNKVIFVELFNGVYRISSDNASYTTKAITKALHDEIRKVITYNLTAFHGAAVEFNSKAFVFLAPTTGGKSTLSSYLVHRGCGYLSDDCILIDPQTMCVQPSPTPIQLREQGYNILCDYNAAPKDFRVLDDGVAQRITYTPSKTVQTPLPIAKIFFIKRTESINKTQEMSLSTSVKALFLSQLSETDDRTLLIQIARRIKDKCSYMFYSNLKYVYDLMNAIPGD